MNLFEFYKDYFKESGDTPGFIFLGIIIFVLIYGCLYFLWKITTTAARKKQVKNADWGWLLFFPVLLVAWITLFFPEIVVLRPTGRGTYGTCTYRVIKIQRAIDEYAKDHDGHYPPKISSLIPGYIKEIPKCPQADSDTYSGSYKATGTNVLRSDRSAYTFFCRGKHHEAGKIPENYPMCSSNTGVITRPQEPEKK